ncbi:Leucine-rich repeat protein soc-2 like protein [Dictyocoela muelleri]|nr:Leucine-rich repeat protein soc-2 like protein [Dictyocoela muelleri]
MKQSPILDKLDLSEKGLYYIPDEAFNEHLTWLILTSNKIRVIPEAIGMLRNLNRLAINNNRLEKVSSALAGLEELSWMDLTRNRLKELPLSLYRLPITGLGLSENEFTEIPQCVLRMKTLRKFGFFSNRIRIVSPSISNLINLIKIDLSNNFISALPDEFCELKNLIWLNLSNNCLKSLPKKFGELVNLEELGLGSNQLEELPDISKLINLRILPVYKNKLKRVCLKNLKNIEKLDLSENEICEFPLEVVYLNSLKYLNLRTNKIKEINLDLHDVVSNVSMIDVCENEIEYLPMKFFKIFGEGTTTRFNYNPYKVKNDIVPQKLNSLNIIAINRIINLGNEIIDKNMCDVCFKFFISEPFYRFNFSTLGDGYTFTMRKTICSVGCFRITQESINEQRRLN